MPKKAIVVWLLLSCLPLYSQAPQWKVIQTVTLTNQTSVISPTTMFTPTKTSLCRLTIYLSMAGAPGSWDLYIKWKDLTGYPQTLLMPIGTNETQKVGIGQKELVFVPVMGNPVSYSVEGGVSGLPYNLALVVEQLQ